MSVPLSQQLSRSELLTRLKALRLERSTSRAGTDASEDSTEMNGGVVCDGAASTNCSSSNSTVNNNNSIVANHGDDDVTQLGLPSFLKKLRQRRKEDRQASKEVSLMEKSNAERLNDYFTTTNVEKGIIRQVEYYFGDHNLPRDRFMRAVMNDNEGWIPMETMMTFKRLSALTTDPDLVMTALEKSPNRVVQVDIESRQLRRHPDNPLPNTESELEKIKIQEKTVYVGGFDRDSTTLDELLELFEGNFEKVVNVKMRYGHVSTKRDADEERAGKENNRKFLGSVWLIFKTEQAAKDFMKMCSIEGKGVTHKGRKLHAKTHKEFMDSRHEDNDEFDPEKLLKTVWVGGFDNLEMTDEELVDFFIMFEGAETIKKRVFRDHSSKDDNEGVWRFRGSVFVTFESLAEARVFYESFNEKDYGKLPLTYKGDKLVIKWQKDFYNEKGKFRRDLRLYEEGQANGNAQN